MDSANTLLFYHDGGKYTVKAFQAGPNSYQKKSIFDEVVYFISSAARAAAFLRQIQVSVQ